MLNGTDSEVQEWCAGHPVPSFLPFPSISLIIQVVSQSSNLKLFKPRLFTFENVVDTQQTEFLFIYLFIWQLIRRMGL